MSARPKSSPFAYGWIAASMLLQSAAMACARQAGLDTTESAFFGILANPWFAGQWACLVAQALCWIMALRQFPLSAAYPMMSLVFAGNLFFARYAFGETLRWNHLAGVALIIAGTAYIATEAEA